MKIQTNTVGKSTKKIYVAYSKGNNTDVEISSAYKHNLDLWLFANEKEATKSPTTP